MLYNAKSIILDLADNHGNGFSIGIRSVDFWLDGSKITVLSADITCYATTSSSPTYNNVLTTFDTSLSKVGNSNYTEWASGATTNQRLICVFDTAIEFDQIRINNYHNSGNNTEIGANNVKINMSTDAITSTVYNEAIANSVEIYDGTFDEHAATDTEDEQILELNSADIVVLIPALTCSMGTNILVDLPVLSGIINAGAYLSSDIPALTCTLEANKFSFAGNLIDSLGALTMTGETDQYREVEGSLGALTCEMVGVVNRLGIDIELPAIISDSHAAGHLSESIPGLTMDAEGSNGILAQLAGEFSELSMIAMSGAFLSDSMAAPVVEIVGTNQVVTKLSSSFSALQATISGKHENLPTIATNLPSLQAALISDNGAVCTINTHFPSLTFNASGYIESINNLTTYLPYMSCNIAASLNGSNTIDFMLHELMMLGIIDNLADDTILRHIRGQVR